MDTKEVPAHLHMLSLSKGLSRVRLRRLGDRMMFSPGRYLVIRDNIVIGIFDRLADARKFAERIKRKPEILIVVDCLVIK